MAAVTFGRLQLSMQFAGRARWIIPAGETNSRATTSGTARATVWTHAGCGRAAVFVSSLRQNLTVTTTWRPKRYGPVTVTVEWDPCFSQGGYGCGMRSLPGKGLIRVMRGTSTSDWFECNLPTSLTLTHHAHCFRFDIAALGARPRPPGRGCLLLYAGAGGDDQGHHRRRAHAPDGRRCRPPAHTVACRFGQHQFSMLWRRRTGVHQPWARRFFFAS